MKKYYVLFNPYSGNGKGEEYARKLNSILNDELIYFSMPKITDFKKFLSMTKGEDIIICGGDGTLNYFINHTDGIKYKNNILYYSTGSGNDFYNDVFKGKGEGPHLINEYLKDLPTVIVKGKEYKFINGIGYGIDGYCCEMGDLHRKKNTKPVNYTKIALKGLLYDYKPTNAIVTVDSVKHAYKKVWLASTMNGRYYGGGMMIAPYQNRLNSDRSLTVVVLHGKIKLKVLTAFATVFKGEHVRFKKIVDLYTAHEVKVEFDRPVALQIDGETILGVTEYTVKSNKK
ncbi:MAG: hypothetical protein MRZ34_04025 [Bacillales bacterium]|nr:hypothetical protein [Bacillales bacterium]